MIFRVGTFLSRVLRLDRRRGSSLVGQEYRHEISLYSDNADQAAHIYEFRSGEVYLKEEERVEGGVFQDRHSGRLVGPFRTAADAERFIVNTAWFNGGKESVSRAGPPQESAAT